VLTDMRMPVVDGLEATRRIRTLPGHRGRTPVVLLTADPDACIRGASGQTGVDVCVMKPFKRGELLAAIAKAARLTPEPEAVSSVRPAPDGAVFSELKKSLDDKTCTAYLAAAATRIQDLLGLLARPDATENPTTRDAVHDLIGVTGLLGLTDLSVRLRQFDIAKDRAAPLVPLREAATEAFHLLRQP
jgi:hypothetical protein